MAHTVFNPSDYFSQQPQAPEKALLHSLQQVALNRFDTLGWPNKQLEKWKYTPAHLFLSPQYELSHTQPSTFASCFHNIGPTLTVTNGVFDQANIHNIHQTPGFSVNHASQSSACQADINTYLTTLNDSPSLISFGLANDIVMIKADSQEPVLLVIHHQIQPSADTEQDETPASLINTPIVIEIASHTDITLLELFEAPPSAHPYLHNQTTRLVQSANSRCRHLRVLQHSQTGQHIGAVHNSLGQEAAYEGLNLALKGQLLRDATRLDCIGQGAQAVWNGLSIGEQQQHIDQGIEVNHQAPHTQSDLLFKSIGQDTSKIHCNGRIHITPQGHCAEGSFYSKSLMLSPKAQVYTKPELEIYHDQVKCAHGATTCAIDSEQLNYLKSRGLSESQAIALLQQGFVQDILMRSWLPSTAYGQQLMADLADIDPIFSAHGDL